MNIADFKRKAAVAVKTPIAKLNINIKFFLLYAILAMQAFSNTNLYFPYLKLYFSKDI